MDIGIIFSSQISKDVFVEKYLDDIVEDFTSAKQQKSILERK